MCECVCAWMVQKSGKTFLKWCRRVHRLSVFFSARPGPVTIIAIVIAWCCCQHCYRRLSVSMIFSTCAYWIVHNMGRHTTHMYTHTHTTRPFASKCVSFPCHIWPLSFQLCTIPCHAILWRLFEMEMLAYNYSIHGTQRDFSMVLKSTHTLSAFSNNFTMCEEFHSLASLPLAFLSIPPSHIHSLRWDRNQWNPAKEEEEEERKTHTHTSHNRKVIFIVNDLNKQNGKRASVCVFQINPIDYFASFLNYSNLSCAAMQ